MLEGLWTSFKREISMNLEKDLIEAACIVNEEHMQHILYIVCRIAKRIYTQGFLSMCWI